MMSNKLTTNEIIDRSIYNERAMHDNEIRTNEMRELSNIRNACTGLSDRIVNGLRKIHKESEHSGLTAELRYGDRTFTLLTLTTMGRIVLTIRDNATEDYITLVCEESGDGGMGLQGLYCEYNDALDILEIVTHYWYTVCEDRLENLKHSFVENKNVTLI